MLQQVYPVVYQDNLKYHLYGGTILAVLGKYEEAQGMLMTVSWIRNVAENL